MLGKIVDRANSFKGSQLSYGEVLRLDCDLNRELDAKPVWTDLPPDDSSSELSPLVMVRQPYMDLVVQCARIVLNRKFLIPAQMNPRYAYSRKSCIKAAKQALQYQRRIYDGSQNLNGAGSNWRFICLMSHDFLLAAMILCLDIDHVLRGSFSAPEDEMEESKQLYTLLESSHSIWTSTAGPKAKKAAAVLGIMLDKVRSHCNHLTDMDTPIRSVASQTDASTVHTSPNREASSAFSQPQATRCAARTAYESKICPGIMNSGMKTYGPLAIQALLDDPAALDWMDWDSRFPIPMPN